ncbi:ribosome maturation factor RimM [Prevotella sp. KH2C16]|uniref:ribosome maturation factor RimM n=1 Tax=Prevotella sp. KH2C16 TaxID=1855325 RepID=UPI0008F25F6C|nr:ribosome maturation factor RimM [Prevotella sp. KH2C16]SFG35693.1 16S rRNA processing protein RimM [Prevotella sp. KH2C16]
MIKQEEVFKIGKLGKPHGVKGEINFLFDDDIFDRTDADYLVLEVDGILVPFFIEAYRFHGNATALVKFCDIETQEQARQLTGCKVFFPRKLSERDEQEVSWSEIAGYQLVDTNTGKTIGEITNVDDSTLNILFEVMTAGQKELLIPASEDLIQNIDKERKEIKINLPEGILDL